MRKGTIMMEKKEKRRTGPKFDKEKCATCRWSCVNGNLGYTTGYFDEKAQKYPIHVYCNVSATGDTCLKRDGSRLVDRRGEDYDNCKLYVTDAKKEKEHIKRNEIIFGRKLKGVTNGRGKKVHTE